MKCNEVKVLKIAQNVASLQVKVLKKQNTSLQLKVLKKLLKYCNALLLLRYFTTLHGFNKYRGSDRNGKKLLGTP